MSVRFKFKNDGKNFMVLSIKDEPGSIEGFISMIGLKKAIVQRKKLGETRFDLIIYDSVTKNMYEKDDDLIPMDSLLIVETKPLPRGQKINWNEIIISTPQLKVQTIFISFSRKCIPKQKRQMQKGIHNVFQSKKKANAKRHPQKNDFIILIKVFSCCSW